MTSASGDRPGAAGARAARSPPSARAARRPARTAPWRRFSGWCATTTLGRSVRYLEYEAYEPLALKAFERIAAEVAARWPGVRLALHHRIGRLEIGEASVAIAAARRIGPTRSPRAATRSSA